MLQNNSIRPRLATRFLIKAGGLKQSGEKTFPEKWDHFKVCSTERNDIGNPEPQNAWMRENLNEEKPTKIPFMFFTNDPEACYDDGYAYRTKTQRLCFSSDGKLAYWQRKKSEGAKSVANKLPDELVVADDSDAETVVVECPGPSCPLQKANKCKINLRLVGFIPKPDEGFVFQGADIFYSSSYNSAAQLRASMDALITLTGGQIAFTPLVLQLQPKKAMVSGKQQTVYIVSFFPSQSVDKLQAKAMSEGQTDIPRTSVLSIPSAVDVEEPEKFHDEFYPEETTRPDLDEMMPDNQHIDAQADEEEMEPESIDIDLKSEIDAMKRDIWDIAQRGGKTEKEIKDLLMSCMADNPKTIYENLRSMKTGLELTIEPSLPGVE